MVRVFSYEVGVAIHLTGFYSQDPLGALEPTLEEMVRVNLPPLSSKLPSSRESTSGKPFPKSPSRLVYLAVRQNMYIPLSRTTCRDYTQIELFKVCRSSSILPYRGRVSHIWRTSDLCFSLYRGPCNPTGLRAYIRCPGRYEFKNSLIFINYRIGADRLTSTTGLRNGFSNRLKVGPVANTQSVAMSI